ncbi:glycosyltransferase [Acidovorax sp. ST3]|uniref:glycosyltransferase n=1 Tax=Acidovorax sp. ST3 TaxID=2219062 RepID=UPI000DA6B9A5|nr:glycosyltransferase [Acidovorax sp. ST3]
MTKFKYKNAILMSAYGPSPYFKEQVATIVAQMNDGDILIIVDDGSRQVKWDSLREVPAKFIFWTRLERLGASASFLQLVVEAGIDAEYYYLSDQDDLWMPDKLSVQAKDARNKPHEINATIHAWLDLKSGEAGGEYKPEFSPLKKLSAAHYCFETPAPGMTMSFNHECQRMFLKNAELIKRFSNQLPHDRILMALAGMYGAVRIISKPLVQYRQHAHNVVGAPGKGLLEIWAKRIRSPFRTWRTVTQGRALYLALIDHNKNATNDVKNHHSLGRMRLRTDPFEDWIIRRFVIFLGFVDRIFSK